MGNTSNSGADCQSAVGTIYLLTCTLNGKQYVGQTRQKLEVRIAQHRRKSKKAKFGVDAAIRVHGWENFTVEVLEICPVELLNEREKFWIRELNTKVPNGYNLTDGGDGTGGRSPSAETRAKISAALKGRPSPNKGKPLSEEHKAKLSANHADVSGENHPFFGRHHSPETKAKLSAVNTGENNPNYGKPRSAETCAKISARHKATGKKPPDFAGRKHSAETKAKISAAHRGKPSPQKGKSHSPETKAKISASLTGKKHTAESRAKMSESQKARRAREKKLLENGGDT